MGLLDDAFADSKSSAPVVANKPGGLLDQAFADEKPAEEAKAAPEATQPKQFDLGATFNDYVAKPVGDAIKGAGDEFNRVGPLATIANAAKGVGAGLAEMNDLAAIPGRATGEALWKAAGGTVRPQPTDLDQFTKLTGAPTGQMAYNAGKLIPQMAIPLGRGGSAAASMVKQGALNAALGEGQSYAQTGHFDPLAAAGQFATGALMAGTVHGINHGLKVGLKGPAVKAAWAAKNAPDRLDRLRAPNQESLDALNGNIGSVPEHVAATERARSSWFDQRLNPTAPEPLAVAPSESYPSIANQRLQDGYWKNPEEFPPQPSPPTPPVAPPSTGGTGVKSTKNQVTDMYRMQSRYGTPQEHQHFANVMDAKLNLDHADHRYNQAFTKFAEHLKAIKHNPLTGAMTQRPGFIPPEHAARFREEAAQAAGIIGRLKEIERPIGGVIRNGAFPEYKPVGKSLLEKAAEIKHLHQERERLQDVYNKALKQANIKGNIPRHNSLVFNKNGHEFELHHRIDKRYSAPTPEQDAAFRKELDKRHADFRANPDNVNEDLKPSIQGLAKALTKTDPELAKLLGKSHFVLDDHETLQAAARSGTLEPYHMFMKKLLESPFVQDERGLGTTDYPLTSAIGILKIATGQPLTMQYAATIAKTPFPLKQGAVMKTMSLSQRTGVALDKLHQAFLNETNMDIFKRAADPLFVGKLQTLIGHRGEILRGIHMPDTVDGMHDWMMLKDHGEIDASKFLTPHQKTALKNYNELKKMGAKLINEEIEKLKASARAKRQTIFGDASLARVMQAELDQNWAPVHKTNAGIVNMMATGSLDAIQRGNPHLHFLHAAEAAHANLVYAGVGKFAKALVLMAKPEARAFAHSFNTKLPISGMREDSLNLVSNSVDRFWENAAKVIPQAIRNNQIVKGAHEFLSGTLTEHEKMNLSLITASEVVAQDMKMTGAALRRDMLTNKMPLDRRIEASARIWDYMERSLGAGPAGYKVLNPVDRASFTMGAITKTFAPFTRSIIQQNRVQTGIMRDAAKAVVAGDLASATKHFGAGVRSLAITASLAGAYTIPKELRDHLAKNDPQTLGKLEGALDNAAVIGHLGGFRLAHIQPRALWFTNIGPNFVQQNFKNVTTLANEKAPARSKQRAATMLAASVGFSNIAGVASPETIRKVANAYSDAATLGGVEHHVFSNPTLPFGLSDTKHIASTLEKEPSPIVAALRVMFSPGESEEAAKFDREWHNNADAEQHVKELYPNLYPQLKKHWNGYLADFHHIEGVEKKLRKAGREVPAEVTKIKYETREAEENADHGGMNARNFWIKVQDRLQKSK
ncbi:MAG TPA: hypothetical protein V6C86_24100 [Oculatellaceae cyanobacterium]